MHLSKRFRSFLQGFAQDDHGATAVEFALISIPLLGLLFASFDMGLGFMVDRNLDAAVQNAARQIRTGQMQGAGVTTPAAFVSNYVCPKTGNMLSTFIDCSKLIVDVRTASAFTGNDLTNDFYKTQNTNQFCLGSPKTITIVRVTYPMPWYLPVLITTGGAQNAGLVNDVPNNAGWKLLLTSASAVRAEPYPSANYAAYQANNGC